MLSRVGCPIAFSWADLRPWMAIHFNSLKCPGYFSIALAGGGGGFTMRSGWPRLNAINMTPRRWFQTPLGPSSYVFPFTRSTELNLKLNSKYLI